MKILAIGDPHGNLEKIKKLPLKNTDLIILTGDLGKADLARKFFFENQKRKQQGLPELEQTKSQRKQVHMEVHNSTIQLLNYLSKYAPIFTIQGNVGIPSKSEVKEEQEKYGIKLPPTREHLKKIKNVRLIKNKIRRFNNIKIGFLEYFVDVSWVKEFKPKDYQKSLSKARKQTEKAQSVLKKFGKEIDVLVCHQPPFGVLDKVNFPGAPPSWQGKHAGSKAILDYIKKYQPRYVFCGHIHEAEGKAKIGKSEIYNLGVCGCKIINI